MLSLPRITSAHAGQDAWISVIIGGIIPLFSLIMIERMGRRFPNLGFVEMSQAVFGKIIGTFLVVIFIAYMVFYSAITVRLFVELTSLYILPQTPRLVISFMTVISVIYIVGKGAKVVARVQELTFYTVLPMFLLFVPAVMFAGEINYLLPVGGAGLSNIMQGALVAAFPYAGVEVLWVAYSWVTHKEDVLKAGITALSITIFIYIMVTIFSLLVFGSDMMQKINWPVLALLKVPHLRVIERLDFFFLIVWMGLGARRAVIMGCVAAYSFSQIIKIDETKYYPLAVWLIGGGMFLLSLIPKDILQVFDYTYYAGYAFLVMALGYPLLFQIVAVIRGDKVQQNV